MCRTEILQKGNKRETMEKLLMLGSTTASVELVRLAKSQGIYTVVTDYLEPEESEAKLEADEYWMLSTADVTALAEKCREEGITAVISGLSEFNIARAAELSETLQLPFYCSSETWYTTSNKYRFKEACRKYRVPVATDYFVSNPPCEDELEAIRFPVVVKAVDLCGNRGMSYCYSKEDVEKACEFARSMSKSERLIVERMLHGREYEAHYVIAEGEASLCCFAAQLPQPGAPENCYGVTTTATNHLQKYLQEVDPCFRKLLKEVGCRDGICWLEMILDEDGHFYVLEMGHRLSGDLIEIALDEAYGFDTFQWLLDSSLGRSHTKAQLPAAVTCLPEKHVFSYIIWSKTAGVLTKVSGIEDITCLPGVRVAFLKEEGEKFRQYQYMFAVNICADDPEKMIELVQYINSRVCMEDEHGENVLLYFDDFATMRRIYAEGKAETLQIPLR